MGSGEKGMAVVNATIFPDYFNKLQQANGNADKKYLTGFKSRGKQPTATITGLWNVALKDFSFI